MKMTAFWNIAPYSLVEFICFSEVLPQSSGRWMIAAVKAPLKHESGSTSLHSAIGLKTAVFILATMRTYKHTSFKIVPIDAEEVITLTH
jgi:hypothetical protein